MKEAYLLYPQPCNVLEDTDMTEPVYFKFEEDFVEDNVRCIPMIVRFKLDTCGIKLKLSEWSKMTIDERKLLAETSCANSHEALQYRSWLQKIVLTRTGAAATDLPVDLNPEWAIKSILPMVLKNKLQEFNWQLTLQQWRGLDNLQRFVLLKLCRPGHENKNFPKAMKEFGLL